MFFIHITHAHKIKIINLKIILTIINYSVSPRINPRDKEAAPKFYATAQRVQTISLDDMAKNISHSTTATRADVLAVLTALIDEMTTELAKGNSIILGELGTFRFTLTSKGAVTAENFKVDMIKKASVRYYPSRTIKNIYDNLTFNRVPARKTVHDILKGDSAGSEEGGEDLTD